MFDNLQPGDKMVMQFHKSPKPPQPGWMTGAGPNAGGGGAAAGAVGAGAGAPPVPPMPPPSGPSVYPGAGAPPDTGVGGVMNGLSAPRVAGPDPLMQRRMLLAQMAQRYGGGA